MEAIALNHAFQTPNPNRNLCGVCGCADIHTDEVVDRGIVLLAECQRCDHRWTESLAPAPAVTAQPLRQPNLRAA